MSATRPDPLLRAEGITAGYGGVPVIQDVSLSVGPGEIVAIIGPNGAGKSTLLKALVGILRVTTGRIMLGDDEVTNRRPEELARRGVGYVPQVQDIFEPLTVLENLEMGGYLLPARDDSRARAGGGRGLSRAQADAQAPRGQAERRRTQDARDRARADARSRGC